MFSRIRPNLVKLCHRQVYHILDHQKMEDQKKKINATTSKPIYRKLKFFWKQTKYTLAQGCKDLWFDMKWIIKLNRKKTRSQFTGFELAESHRIIIDVMKFIPYSILLMIPLAQAAIPLVVWLFPNAIPTFFLFDTAYDQRIQQCEMRQKQSHEYLIDKMTDILSNKLSIPESDFSNYDFFKSDLFEVIQQLEQHLNYRQFNSDELIKVLEFLGGGDFVTGTFSINKIVNVFTLSIPRLLVKTCRLFKEKVLKKSLEEYEDPWFVKGNFKLLKFNYFPFEFFKRKFLLFQIERKFRMLLTQDKAFQKYGMNDIIGANIKQFARERGFATLSCYETLKNVILNDWVKITTHPKFENNNTKLWYSVMMYEFLKESSMDIN